MGKKLYSATIQFPGLHRIILITCFLLPFVNNVYADEGNKDEKEAHLSPLFQSLDPIKLHLAAPFSKLIWNRGNERPYHQAIMTYNNEEGEKVDVNLKIRVRGKSRANLKNCKFPQLRLNFKRKSLKDTIFQGENNLKLVTHCNSSSRYEQYLLLEYMNYRVLHLFTDKSLRVRLVEITYYDSGKNKEVATKPAFFLEDFGRMADRLGMKTIKAKKLDPKQYDQEQLNMVEVFEYFLGNTDWSVVGGPSDENCCHNMIPLQSEDDSFIPVPYDFDSTGVVDPPYATVSDKLFLRSVRQRLYRGFCQSEDINQVTFETFQDKRQDIIALYENQKGLKERTIKKTIRYYDDFYATIANQKKQKKAFQNKCRQKP